MATRCPRLFLLGIEQRRTRSFWTVNVALMGALLIALQWGLKGKTFTDAEFAVGAFLATPVMVFIWVLVGCVVELTIATWCYVDRRDMLLVRGPILAWPARLRIADTQGIDASDGFDRIEISSASGSIRLGPWSTKSILPHRWYQRMRGRFVDCVKARLLELNSNREAMKQ
jgi:hypothetical protein